MKSGEKEVKSKSKTVGTAKFEIFDSPAEALATLGEAAVLDLINQQHKTNACNTLRRAATAGPSTRDLEMEVMSSLTTEDLLSFQGDQVKAAAFIKAKVEELKRARGVVAATEDDDEENK
jgi:hypothetical protein